MSNYSKADINSRYDKLRAQLKAGSISQSSFKAAADRLYKLYHSKQNTAARNKSVKPTTKLQKAVQATKAAKTNTTTNKTKPPKPKASNKAVSGGYTISARNRKPGSRGEKGWIYSTQQGVRTAYNDVSGAHWYHDGSKWVKGKLGKVTRFKGPK